VLPPEATLKSLQVKAELAKLGNAPRAYVEKIKMEEEEEMHVDEANSHRTPLTERFDKIQGARPGPIKGISAVGNNGPADAKRR
jgi:hypothetical protein